MLGSGAFDVAKAMQDGRDVIGSARIRKQTPRPTSIFPLFLTIYAEDLPGRRV
jgi:hypothetical protein